MSFYRALRHLPTVLKSKARNLIDRCNILKHQSSSRKWTTLFNRWNVDRKDVQKRRDAVAITGVPHNRMEAKTPSRKVALLLAYVGTRYYGSQRNGSLPTVDRELLIALKASKVALDFELTKPGSLRYCSASRTDKGVSSCGQVVSVILRLNDETVDRINHHLPADIRVLGINRSTRSFNAMYFADARTYSYTMPTYAFANPENVCNSYRISAGKLEHIRSVIYRFRGTHTYHNFTRDVRIGQGCAVRYIIEFFHGEPFVKRDVEFIKFTIKGQSFMIHQIRKMMGLLIALVSHHACEEHFIRAFSEPFEDIPKAPGTGLMLEKVHFFGYRKRFGHLYGGMDFPDAEHAQEEFVNQMIIPQIVRKNMEDGCMLEWLQTLPKHYVKEQSRCSGS